jgi:hypothetical protein
LKSDFDGGLSDEFVLLMGQELGLELREDSLMTKVMLKQQQEVIDHIEEEKIEVNRPINLVSPHSRRWGTLSCTTPPIRDSKNS